MLSSSEEFFICYIKVCNQSGKIVWNRENESAHFIETWDYVVDEHTSWSSDILRMAEKVWANLSCFFDATKYPPRIVLLLWSSHNICSLIFLFRGVGHHHNKGGQTVNRKMCDW